MFVHHKVCESFNAVDRLLSPLCLHMLAPRYENDFPTIYLMSVNCSHSKKSQQPNVIRITMRLYFILRTLHHSTCSSNAQRMEFICSMKSCSVHRIQFRYFGHRSNEPWIHDENQNMHIFMTLYRSINRTWFLLMCWRFDFPGGASNRLI